MGRRVQGLGEELLAERCPPTTGRGGYGRTALRDVVAGAGEGDSSRPTPAWETRAARLEGD